VSVLLSFAMILDESMLEDVHGKTCRNTSNLATLIQIAIAIFRLGRGNVDQSELPRTFG